jgi:hypothetical protein
MKPVLSARSVRVRQTTLALALSLAAGGAAADAVTDWNYYSILATKGLTDTGVSPIAGNPAIAQNSNVATRIEAIEARAVYDAVNAITRFSPKSYYYTIPAAPGGATANSAKSAAAQAAHDVLLATLPNNANWTATRAWLDARLAESLAGVSPTDPGIAVGQAAAVAAVAARAGDFSAPRTTYTPSTNITATGGVNATGNPGAGVWRPSNGGAGDVNPTTGSPTGFNTSGIVPAAAIDFNWKNVTPFSLSTLKKQQLVALVPPSLKLSADPGSEYQKELEYVKTRGQEIGAPSTSRSGDQTLQALYYKSDAEVFVNEAARYASQARGLSLQQKAKLFALLDNALADARIAAWQSKYDLVFWRPVTALNADLATGAVASYDWKPLATTPAHPSSTSGHSATVAAGTEVLRSFFGTDDILPGGVPVTLSALPWTIGTNNGTGKANPLINGSDGTTRSVTTFTRLQLENGQSRLYLGVHYGTDNYQGQQLGLAVADAIIQAKTDPASAGVSVFAGGPGVASAGRLWSILVSDSANSGFYGL